MNHPDSSLIDYIDGTLAPDARTEIVAHLRVCDRCREDVRLAGAGHDAVHGLPDVAPPADLASSVIAEAERMAAESAPEVASLDTTRARRPRPATPRWLAIAGAAAAIVMIALVAPKLGEDGPTQKAESAAGATTADTAYPLATVVEFQDVDYGADIVQRVAATYDRAFAGAQPTAAEGAGESPVAAAIPSLAGSDATVETSGERLPAATRCLARAYDSEGGTLTRLIAARFEGEPAYLGVYLQGPGAGLPPEALLVVVASRDGCRALTVGSHTLP